MKKKQDDDVIRETQEHNILPCDMTKEELAQENINLLNTLQAVDDLESERKALVADCKSRKERLGQISDESRHKLRSKQVMRAIPCTLYLNFTKLTATTVRLDTGEQVNQRPMNQDERNMLNATPTLWPEKDASPDPTETDTPTDSGTETSDPVTGTQLTEQEATDHATEMFGPDDLGLIPLTHDEDISDAADLSEDEDPEEWGMDK